jgi:hypothetical protein
MLIVLVICYLLTVYRDHHRNRCAIASLTPDIDFTVRMIDPLDKPDEAEMPLLREIVHAGRNLEPATIIANLEPKLPVETIN